MKLDAATVCLPVTNRPVSHAFHTTVGFVTVGELGDDGLPSPSSRRDPAELHLEAFLPADDRTAEVLRRRWG